MRKILIVDPRCRRLYGHPYPTTKALASALARHRPIVAIHRSAGPEIVFEEGVTVWRWQKGQGRLARLSETILRSVSGEAARRRRMADILSGLIARAGLGDGDAVVMHSMRPGEAGAVADIAGRHAAGTGPAFYLRLFVDTQVAAVADGSEASRGLDALAAVARRNPLVRVHTETAEMARDLASRFRLTDVSPWLLPMAVRARASDKPDPAGGFTIGMLGGKRPEQGADMLPAIIRALPAAFPRRTRFRILFQKPSALFGRYAKRRAAESLLCDIARAAEGVCPVEYLAAELDQAAFGEAVTRSHVFVLPYDAAAYGRRGSGLIVDAALSGTPIVITAGLAMEEWTRLAGSWTANTAEDFARGIGDIARDYGRYSARALHAGEVMREAIGRSIAAISGEPDGSAG